MQQVNSKEERNSKYLKYVEAVSPKTSAKNSLLKSFWVGGVTCCIGQLINDLLIYLMPTTDIDMIGNYTLVIIISIAIILTGVGIYDRIGRYAGAGAFLPITGFANAISSASLEFKTEGLIFGSENKMFSIVGPVIINGVVWSTLVGLIHLIISVFI